MMNMMINDKRIHEKSRTTKGTPTKTGISHKGTITGICFLNFSPKLSIGAFSRNLAAIRPYPQGHDFVFQYPQYGHTKIIIHRLPSSPYATKATAVIIPQKELPRDTSMITAPRIHIKI
jgi:hypothetical protein